MALRYSREDKGKAIVPESTPALKRVRATSLDNSDLIKKHELTLIGRLTNSKVQRLWSFIPFISQKWDLRGKAIGSDLGDGCFQFRFDFPDDLQKVLENRPYYFAKWMVILQKWEPIISNSFPNEIPFWINVKGLPLHFWKEEMLLRIGNAVGTATKVDISPIYAKVRTTINGLKPLTKELLVEYSKGNEERVQLEYERLANHCHICASLYHDDTKCDKKMSSQTSTGKQDLQHTLSPQSRYQSNNIIHQNLPTRQVENTQRKLNVEALFSQRRDRHGNLFGPRTFSSKHSGDSHRRLSPRRNTGSREISTIPKTQKFLGSPQERHSTRNNSLEKKSSSSHCRNNELSNVNINPQQRESMPPPLIWREKSPEGSSSGKSITGSSRTRGPPLERNLNAEDV